MSGDHAEHNGKDTNMQKQKGDPKGTVVAVLGAILAVSNPVVFATVMGVYGVVIGGLVVLNYFQRVQQ